VWSRIFARRFVQKPSRFAVFFPAFRDKSTYRFPHITYRSSVVTSVTFTWGQRKALTRPVLCDVHVQGLAG